MCWDVLQCTCIVATAIIILPYRFLVQCLIVYAVRIHYNYFSF